MDQYFKVLVHNQFYDKVKLLPLAKFLVNIGQSEILKSTLFCAVDALDLQMTFVGSEEHSEDC